MSEHLVQPIEEDPFRQETQDFWIEVGKEYVRSSVKTIDETAKQIIAVSGILEGLYFHAITFSDIRGQLSGGWTVIVYLVPIFILLVSLSTALLVFFPDRYRIDIRAPKAAQVIHARVVSSKFLLMRIAAISLMLGVFALFVAVAYYLSG